MNDIPREPSPIHDHETSDSWSHWDIYHAFHPLDTTPAQQATDLYYQIANGFQEAVGFFAGRLRQSSSAAWQGAAADASRKAVGDYAQHALDLSTALGDLHDSVSAAVMNIVNTKSNVPEPKSGVGWNVFNPDGWSWFGGSRSHEAIDEAKDSARTAMTNNYVNPFVQHNGNIPVLPVPSSPTNPVNTWNPGTSPGTPGGNQPGGTNPGGTAPGGSNPGDPGTPGAPNQPGNPNQPGDPQQQGQPTDPSQDSTTTDPSSLPPAAATPTTPSGLDPSAAPTTPSSVDPGAPGFPGGSPGFGGLPGGGDPASTPGGPGRSAPGRPGTPGGPANPTAAAAKPGAAGAPGMGGMGGARGNKSESDERTHDLPEWLRNMENTEELLGPDPRTIPDGVIGGDYPNQQPPSSDRTGENG